jgi:hypothetical protein
MFTTPGPLDFVAIARRVREFGDREQVFDRLVAQNRGGPRRAWRRDGGQDADLAADPGPRGRPARARAAVRRGLPWCDVASHRG